MELLSEIQATSPENYEEIHILASRVYSTLTEETGPSRVYELFGEQGGFLIVGQLLAAIQRGRDVTDEDASTWLSRLLLLTLQILTDAITWSRHNLHSFERLLGWDSLVATLMEAVPSSIPSRTIAMLFGMALGQVTIGIEQFKLVSEAIRAGQIRGGTARDLPIVHPAAIYAAVSLAEEDQIVPNVREATYSLLHDILVSNERNTNVLSRTRVPSLLLRAWLAGRRLPTETSVLRLLWQDGIKNAEDVRIIFTHLMQSPLDNECELLGLLHDVAISAHRPASLTIDAKTAPSDHCPTGIHIRALPRPFPSDNPTSAGFSLAMLLRIEHTTPDASLDLFRLESVPAHPLRLILDMTLGTLMYEPGGATRQAYRLPRTQLEQHAWHSVVLTHTRSMPRVPSTVHVYLDGKRVCTLQVPWPGAFATPASVWLGGTPVVGEGHATWSLSSVFLMDGLIPPSIPALLHELVPTYTGNLQAPLARFLPYAGLTRIHTRLHELAGASTPRGQSHSFRTLKCALHMAAADIFPLEHVYLHLQADHTLRCGTQVLVPNQTLPILLKDMRPSELHGTVEGLPTLRLPRRLDEAVWSLGGCAVLLRLVELANSTASLEACVSLFLRLVSFSWRLAEDAERIRAFGIFGALLRAKARMISVPILAALQEAAAPKASWANVQLYRAVLLDTDLWVCTSEAVQLAYAQHFQKLLPLGGRGLADVHLVRRLIHFSMRASCVPSHVLDQVMQAALEGHFRARNIQALVQFVAIQLGHVAPNAASLGAAKARTDESLFIAPMEASQFVVPPPATQDPRGCELARLWLATFLRLLAEDDALVKLAASAIQAQWLLMLLRPGLLPEDAELVVPLAQKLLSASPSLAHAFTRMGGFRKARYIVVRHVFGA
ncbi:beige protein-like 1 [Malassezia caprae]|uniref:Beige protein-like 1 n=1 Tax=Malassezia caprae TaxID=1381934 RepID=A0AAF0E5A5_9BASI|nr:beige protein-like 1 [Malassezia caprae]